ncbi:L-ascorbate oxidase homolog [Abrus precatorius]|uniref:L-ascorbate oxidase homolog n=1 Tax=Abrus precatorius TaxID=3816 RepID=A0A8B8KVX5_ABRPR|nr:L-ascorbate oxidase homolog [Abrus precatorius]
MKQIIFPQVFLGILACWSVLSVIAEDRYLFFTWEITRGTINPLGEPQPGILINGQFPGPTIEAITNDNIVVNVINKMDEKFLITWNGIKQRRTSWQDGVLGTNCPIPPNTNWTYKFQVKDQIGTYTYFPSTKIHKAAGGFGGFNIAQRIVIPIPYPAPDGEFTLLIGDWYKTDHKILRRLLDAGKSLPNPDALLINGQNNAVFTGEAGKTYKFRVSNVGLATSFNFRIQGHSLKLIEVEGAHTIQESYESLDVHVGQSVTVLVKLNESISDYSIVASSRFTELVLTTTATLRYLGSKSKATIPLPVGPATDDVEWSMKQARTIRLNLTANAARPNPQGSFHYGTIPVVRTVKLENSEATTNGKLRYAVNGISYFNPNTPLKLADWFNIPGVFNLDTIKDVPPPPGTLAKIGTSVIGFTLHDYVEIVFHNNEKYIQSWHMDGSSFYVVG